MSRKYLQCGAEGSWDKKDNDNVSLTNRRDKKTGKEEKIPFGTKSNAL